MTKAGGIQGGEAEETLEDGGRGRSRDPAQHSARIVRRFPLRAMGVLALEYWILGLLHGLIS